MRLTLVAIGKLKAGPDRALFERYWARVAAAGRAAGITSVKQIELAESRATSADARKADETERLIKAAGAGAPYLIALDERGSVMDSHAFAQEVRMVADAGRTDLVVLIGGPDGHDAGLRGRVDRQLSLGRLTLPHGLARIVIAEQLYRATTILAGHPYHRG